MTARPRRVWIDLTNSPHVVFFRPILRRLDEAGVESVVTARDFAQTLGLLERFGIPHTDIGRHGVAQVWVCCAAPPLWCASAGGAA
jgi:predicted glycosyltransferase